MWWDSDNGPPNFLKASINPYSSSDEAFGAASNVHKSTWEASFDYGILAAAYVGGSSGGVSIWNYCRDRVFPVRGRVSSCWLS